MPPYLHPRSSATTTLFASTLAASFIVIGIPHVFPCPASRKAILDSDGSDRAATAREQRQRRRTTSGQRKQHQGRESEQREKGSEGFDGTERPTLIIGEQEARQRENTENGPSRFGNEVRTLLRNGGVIQDLGSRPSETSRLAINDKAKQMAEKEDEERSLYRDVEEAEGAVLERGRRQCPVPKPTGRIGELLGFGSDGKRRNGGWPSRDD